MPIHRAPKTRKYARILNAVVENKDISWEARGVIVYVLTKPDNWKLRVYDLMNHGPASDLKIRRILKELERAGHLYRKKMKTPDGRFEWRTEIYESPKDNPHDHLKS